jgi:hypothetical protein
LNIELARLKYFMVYQRSRMDKDAGVFISVDAGCGLVG